MGAPNGDSLRARSRSTWIHWWSPVASAKRTISSNFIVRHSDLPRSRPASASRPAIPSITVLLAMAPRHITAPRTLLGRGVAGVRDRLLQLLAGGLRVLVRHGDRHLREVRRGVGDSLDRPDRHLGLVGVTLAVPPGNLERHRPFGGAHGWRDEQSGGKRQGGHPVHDLDDSGARARRRGGRMSCRVDIRGAPRDTRRMPRLETGLRRARQKSGFTQGELANRAGISRQTLSILESGRGQPSTLVALRLSRALRCRVEELFWLREEGGELHAEMAGPRERSGPGPRRALVGSVAGRWVAHLLRRRDPLGLTTAADALVSRSPRDGEPARLSALRPLESLQANVLVIGCDPGLAVLAGRVEDRWPGQRLCWIGASSDAALATLARGHAHVAGARRLLDRLMRKARVPSSAVSGYDRLLDGHLEVAQAVAMGAADAGVVARSAALAHGLDFVPLSEERFDLVFPKEWSGDVRAARIVETLESRAFRRELGALQGYDTRRSGQLVCELKP